MQGRWPDMPSYQPCELRQRPVARNTKRPDSFVIFPPRFCHGSSFVERQEPMPVQALVTEPAVE